MKIVTSCGISAIKHLGLNMSLNNSNKPAANHQTSFSATELYFAVLPSSSTKTVVASFGVCTRTVTATASMSLREPL